MASRKRNSRRQPRPNNSNLLATFEQAMQHPNESKAVALPLDQIVIHDAIQVRVNGLDKKRVEQYRIIIESGRAIANGEGETEDELPEQTHETGPIMEPIVVFANNDEYVLADGFHRVEAHKLAGMDTIYAYVRQGTYDDAYQYAEESNLEHGLAFSNADKREIIRRRMVQGRVWFDRQANGTVEQIAGNRQIAAVLGVSHPTIANWISEIEADMSANGAEAINIDRTKVVGRDGRTRDVTQIGKTGNLGKASGQRKKPVPQKPVDEHADHAKDDASLPSIAEPSPPESDIRTITLNLPEDYENATLPHMATSTGATVQERLSQATELLMSIDLEDVSSLATLSRQDVEANLARVQRIYRWSVAIQQELERLLEATDEPNL